MAKKRKRDPAFVTHLIEMHACRDAIRWLRRKKFRTLQQAWDACKSQYWMRWLCLRSPSRFMWRKCAKADVYWEADRNAPVYENYRQTRAARTDIVRVFYPKAPRLPARKKS